MKFPNEYEKKLEAALERLADAIPPQSNDKDWWPDELTAAVKEAKELLER